MDRVFTLLLTLGISQSVVNWLKRRPLLVIAVLGVAAWIPVIFLGWLFVRLLG